MGELNALASAVFYAVSSLILKPQTDRVNAVTMNVVRCAVGALFFVAWLLLAGALPSIAAIPAGNWFWLISSVMCSLAAGDTFFFLSMRLIGVGRAFPISATYPLFTVVYTAVLGIDEITPRLVAAGVLVVAGVVLIGLKREPDFDLRKVNRLGIFYALVSAALVGLSPALLRNGLIGVDTVTAGAVRLPAATLVLIVTMFSPVGRAMSKSVPTKWSSGTVLALVLGGLAGTALSTVFLLNGIKEIGAARTSIISSCAPLLAVLPSWLWLKESLNRRIIAGTLATVAGVALAF